MSILNIFVPISKASSPSGYGIVALLNDRNVCFVNAVLQALFQVSPLFMYFTRQQEEEEIKEDIKKSLFWEFGSIILATSDLSRVKAADTRRFLAGLGKYFPSVRRSFDFLT